MFRYIKFSNVKLSIDLNPFVWGFSYKRQRPTHRDPTLNIWWWRILFFSIFVVIDDGTYEEWEEELTPTTNEVEADEYG